MKKWLLALIPASMMRNHKDPMTKYDTVPLELMYNTFIGSFEISHEDINEVISKLKITWNPMDEILPMLNTICELLRDKAEMEGNATYTDADFIHYAYLAISNTKRFVKQCKRWNKKPLAQQNTQALFEAFFIKEYEEWIEKEHWLQEMGIANSTQMQQRVQ